MEMAFLSIKATGIFRKGQRSTRSAFSFVLGPSSHRKRHDFDRSLPPLKAQRATRSFLVLSALKPPIVERFSAPELALLATPHGIADIALNIQYTEHRAPSNRGARLVHDRCCQSG
jgi:hypothetical protein